MATIKELIAEKDYDYVEYRLTLPEKAGGGSTFFGCFRTENGKIIPLDHDTYDENEEVLEHNEFTNEEHGIKNGLSITCEGFWTNLDGEEIS